MALPTLIQISRICNTVTTLIPLLPWGHEWVFRYPFSLFQAFKRQSSHYLMLLIWLLDEYWGQIYQKNLGMGQTPPPPFFWQCQDLGSTIDNCLLCEVLQSGSLGKAFDLQASPAQFCHRLATTSDSWQNAALGLTFNSHLIKASQPGPRNAYANERNILVAIAG